MIYYTYIRFLFQFNQIIKKYLNYFSFKEKYNLNIWKSILYILNVILYIYIYNLYKILNITYKTYVINTN